MNNITLNKNFLNLTDTYKHSHWAQFPPDMRGLVTYLEARKGAQHDWVRFYGLQGILKSFFANPFTAADIDEQEQRVNAHVGPGIFNRAGWEHILRVHGGYAPIKIYAVPEGMDIPVGNVLMRVESTDTEVAWITDFIEPLLEQIWAPITVATVSAHCRQIIKRDLDRSSEIGDEVLPFRLHDFGLRGVSSMESAAILGSAHLLSFMGTDTMPALEYVEKMYGPSNLMPGLSIPAGEHTTILAWGPDGEAAYLENLFDRFLKPGAIVAAPIDTYDPKRFINEYICGRFRDRIKNSGGTFVSRPDSGDPTEVVPDVLRDLANGFGVQRNTKGYDVLHPSVREIFGDGMSPTSIEKTNAATMSAGFSTENIGAGMGGGLLQKVNRDMERFAYKGSAVQRGDGQWLGIRKVVASDPTKASKAGRLALVRNDRWNDYSTNHGYETVQIENLHGRKDLLRPVWETGKLLVDEDFTTIRARSGN